ncbi:hypothetical protein Mterra_02499 [Calidithermus terrae]|uniref:DUF3108 domain-containing protein n=1 Tax=Calidithermus terrae TaxID=1408545 RepID=A0A399EGH4_9DEIN|nr:DUF3108 domain-containing protein [Calidithermus terrae]RIH82836.1 hypothetical protein Mterra_02499 [Calidithermus terrae]
MQLFRLILIGLIASAPAALAAKTPWSSGEKLVYRFSWVGVEAGELQVVAQAQGAGWRFQGKLIPKGLGVLLGYGFEVESVVNEQLHTLRFVKTLVEPFKGTTRLLAERSASQEPLVATVIEPNGQQRSYKADVREVLDDLSVLYFLRVNPDVKSVQMVDFNSVIQGKPEVLNKSKEGLLGYRITQNGATVEVWLRDDARRTPVMLAFGRDWGRLEARLIE